MHYVATASPPSVALSAVKSNFIEGENESLIVNKLNRLEVYEVHPDPSPSLQSILEIPIFGSIAAFIAINLPGHVTSTLLVLTTSLQLFALEYSPSSSSSTSSSPSSSSIVTVSSVSLLEKYARLSDFQTILYDEEERCIIVHAYQGVIKVIPLRDISLRGQKSKKAAKVPQKGEEEEEALVLDLSMGYNVRLPALNLTSLELVPASADATAATAEEDEDEEDDEDETKGPVLALVHGNHLGQRVLQIYELDLHDKELVEGPFGVKELVLLDQGSERLLVVAGGAGEEGVVVIGEESLKWVALVKSNQNGAGASDKGKGKANDKKSKDVECRMPIGLIQACTPLVGAVDKYLLGDIYGKLFLLNLVRSKGRVVELSLKDLGDTSSPTSIVALTTPLIYISSRFADSQLIRLPSSLTTTTPDADAMDSEDGENEGDDDISLLASYTSLAPILDCCIVESEGGGASSVVTCSGAYKGGSLRVVRQGVGLDELAALEMEGVQKVFSVRSGEQDLLVLSFFNETRILSFAAPVEAMIEDGKDGDVEAEEGEEIEEIDLPAFASTTATLHAANIGSIILQVTSLGISYSDSAVGDGAAIMRWKHDEGKKITLATSDAKWVVLAIEGGSVIVLEFVDGKIVVNKTSEVPNEIACLSIASSHLSASPILSIGLWTSQSLLLFSLPTLAPLLSVIVDSEYLIRSVLLVDLGDGASYLFAGLGDGSLSSYTVNKGVDGLSVEKSSKKTVVLGTRPIVMCVFEAEEGGPKSIFVSSDRPTIVSRKGDRLVYSSVNLKEINSLTPFSTPLYPSALALISPTGLQIGRIRSIQHVDIRTVPLEEDEPRRITHDAKSKTFAVVCARRDVNRVTGEQIVKGMVKILDDQTYQVLADIPLQLNEEGQSVTVVPSESNPTVNMFVIGTALIDEKETEPSKGRLLIVAEKPLGKNGERSFEIVGQREVKGCVYALAKVSGPYLAAAINSRVIVYSISLAYDLTPLATWGGSFISLNLASRLDTLIVGDAMRSITLLRFVPSQPAPMNTPSLLEIARDYNAHYMAAVESLAATEDDDTTVVGEEFIGAETDLNLFTVQKEDVTTSRSMADEVGFGERGGFHLGAMVSKFCRGSLVQQFSDSSSNAMATPRLVYATSAGSLGVVVDLSTQSSKLLSDLERNMRRVIIGTGELTQEAWRSFKTDHKNVPSSGFIDGDFIESLTQCSEEQLVEIINGGNEFEKLEVEGKDDLFKLVEELARMH